MFPKYGLFDFFESHSVDITEISNIEWGDRELPTDLTAVIEDGTVIGVKWPVAGRSGGRASGKKAAKKATTSVFSAKLLKAYGMLSTHYAGYNQK